jgi:hypothetical protein
MFSNTCQQFNVLGEHSLQHIVWKDVVRRNFGIRRSLRQALAPSVPLGEPSRFAEGQWVQVLDVPGVRATLDQRSRTRGLLFLDYQWIYCGGVFRVQSVMRRMIDDDGFFRPISRTVLLEGIDCGGAHGTTGCGRHCPLMFRDEWLVPAAAPARAGASDAVAYKRVRPMGEIRATLDWQGKRHGLMFMPEMERWADQRFRLARTVQRVFELGRHTATPRTFYILDGLHCSGAVLGERGPCHRACSVLWHGDWLADEA